jgi:hypothetical protein
LQHIEAALDVEEAALSQIHRTIGKQLSRLKLEERMLIMLQEKLRAEAGQANAANRLAIRAAAEAEEEPSSSESESASSSEEEEHEEEEQQEEEEKVVKPSKKPPPKNRGGRGGPQLPKKKQKT